VSDGVAIPAWLLVLMASLALWALYGARGGAGAALSGDASREPGDRRTRRAPAHRNPALPAHQASGAHPQPARRRQVQAAAEKYARDKDITLPAALRRVERYAREIVPAFNAYSTSASATGSGAG